MIAIYERLCTEELLESRRGSGTYVSLRIPALRPSADRPAKASPPGWLVETMERRASIPAGRTVQAQPGDMMELRPGYVDPKLFPFDHFRKSMAKALRYMERSSVLHGSERCQGDPMLRRAIADHAALMRSLACNPDDMVITSGARQAIDLLARTLVDRGTTVVAIEEPRHPLVSEPFEAAGALVRSVPMDRDGMIVDLIPENANIICVSPSCPFPLGVAMSPGRRRELRDFATQRNCLVIEDDYGGELRTSGESLPTLYGRDPNSTFYVGTFSTSMLPSFRLGFLIAPAWALDPIIRAKRHGAWQSSSVMQAATARFIADGYLSAHIARNRALYATRKAALAEAIAARFGEFLRPLPSNYGIHLSAIGNPAINWRSVAERARQEAIHVSSLAQYYDGAPQQGLVFGIAAEPRGRLQLGIERLATLI